jgi:Spy/CpxP family protein refolding chaperone
MKNKLVVIIFLFANITPVALFARDNSNDTNPQRSATQLSVVAVEHPDSTAQPNPAPTQENDIVMVSLPFSSLQLNPTLTDYLSLTPSQVEAIQRVMNRERHSLEPLMAQLRITREKLLAIGGDHMNEKQVKDLAQTEAALLAKLIVANARMQSKIYKVLSPEQQKKLSDLERTQGITTIEGQ